MKCLRALFFGAMLLAVSGCGKSDVAKRLSASSTSTDNTVNGVEDKTGTYSNAYVNLWVSPAREGKSDILASDNLDLYVSKSRVDLPDLKNLNTGLESSLLKIRNASNDTYLTKYSSYASTHSVPWTNKDFQNFMAYGHFSKGLSTALNLFPNAGITNKSNSQNQKLFPLTVYANEPGSTCGSSACDATATGYDPFGSNVSFYKMGDTSENLPRFNLIDEGDVAYHEFGHVLQHAFNRLVLELDPGQNPSVDAILEGLSDYWSATVLKTDVLFPYMGNNIKKIFANRVVRYGPDYNRQLNQDLKFPGAYIWEAHMDGRVLAQALNDVRKYFQSNANLPSGCYRVNGDTSNPCQKDFNLSVSKAFEETAKLAMNAFANMSPSSTLHRYSWLILNEWWNTADSGLCYGKSNTCKTNTLDGIMHIFRRRGLLSIRTDIADYDNPQDSSLKFNPALAISSNAGALKFIPYPGKSNDDDILDPCETVLVVPNLTNTSANYTVNGKSYAVDWVDGLLKMTSFSGFTTTNYETNVTSSSNLKMLPWLSPGDSVYDLVKNQSSRLYDISPGAGNGSSMIKPLDSNHQTSKVGWVLKAPASGSVSVTIQLSQIRPYNSSSNLWKSTTFTQTATVNTSSGHNFCN